MQPIVVLRAQFSPVKCSKIFSFTCRAELYAHVVLRIHGYAPECRSGLGGDMWGGLIMFEN